MTSHRFIIGAVAVAVVLAGVVVAFVTTGHVERRGEPFGLSVNTDPPPDGACQPFKYRSPVYVVDALASGEETARGSYVFFATWVAGFDAVAPPEVAQQSHALRSAVDAWPANPGSLSAPAVRPAAVAIEAWYQGACNLDDRIG